MKKPQLTRREKQRHTRTCLLHAASRLFSQRGLEGASVDEIAQLAGYTKGAFYANFKSKEELFLVMLDERFSQELERLDRALTGTDDPLQEALVAAADFIHFAGDAQWPKLYFQFVAHAARDEEFRQELATRQQAMRERLTEIFARWKEGMDTQPPMPMEQITAMIYCMADGFLVDRMIEPALDEQVYTAMIGVFIRGLQALAEEHTAQGPHAAAGA